MLKKNDIVNVKITDYTQEGLGVGKTEGFPLFIKDSAVGDELEVKVTKPGKSYGYARLEKIIIPSPDRTDPVCPYSGKCGGCQLRHITYSAQLVWKADRVENVMRRIGGVTAGEDYEMMPAVPAGNTDRYRNKAQYPVGIRVNEGKKEIVTGFYAGRTHSVVPCEDCLIEPEINAGILQEIRTFADKRNISVYDEKSGKGLLRHVLIRNGFYTGEIMVCIVVNALPGERDKYTDLPDLAGSLSRIKGVVSVMLNFNRKKTNVILGDKESLLFGKDFIQDKIGEKIYKISAASFFQVNPEQTVRLYKKALEYADLKGNEIVWDLYCGTGTISVFLADKAGMVYGVEISGDAVNDAKENAKLNGADNVLFFRGKAEEIVIDNGVGNDTKMAGKKNSDDGMIKLPSPDVIVVDPPRKGCDGALLDTIKNSGAKKLVYVSCNPATLARDTAVLSGHGYKIHRLTPVDMFPHTTGVECVAEFGI